MINSTPHDTVEYEGEMASWRDIVAIYAVKHNLTTGEADVVEWDEGKEAALKSVMWDMNVLSKSTRAEQSYDNSLGAWAETVTAADETGSEPAVLLTIVLTITNNSKTAAQMAEEYGFDEAEKETLEEILSSDFDAEWEAILGDVAEREAGNVIIGSGKLSWPCQGRITSEYGYRPRPNYGYLQLHTGIDIAVPTGTPIHAAEDGVVTFAGAKGSYGNAVILDHGGGITTLYGHNSRLAVKAGDSVKRGDTIAYAGSTGNSTGPHCHFEVRINGVAKNPRSYL
jgi:murein DD-endopeptidase MepM/ murein hydrolase activator NlpD